MPAVDDVAIDEAVEAGSSLIGESGSDVERLMSWASAAHFGACGERQQQ